jgi:hypothetical protein
MLKEETGGQKRKFILELRCGEGSYRSMKEGKEDRDRE